MLSLRIKKALLVFVAVAVAGCIDPIDLDVGPPERRLVVEGLVREGPGPHYVTLSRTGTFTQGIDAIRPREGGAIVAVITGGGDEIPFTEVAAGRYEPLPGALVGEVGQTYTLSLRLTDGSAYRSTPELLRAAPEIRDFYAELEPYTDVVNGVTVERHRVVLYADAERTPDRPDYYRWMWSGTYAIQACTEFGCSTCYRDIESRELVRVGDDLRTTGEIVLRNRIADLRLRSRLPAEGSRTPPVIGWAFAQGFRITLEQQAIGAQAHDYWQEIRNLRDNVGGLFDPPPDDVRGNVRSVDDPRTVALGHFTVAGTTHRSDCFRRAQFEPDWPGLPTPFSFFGVCGQSVPGSTTPPPEWTAHCATQ